jgi:hypothetical protein
MNRAFFIILIPVLLVAMGYVAVFRFMGIAPGYPRLIVVMALFSGAIYWFSRRNAGKRSASRQ